MINLELHPVDRNGIEYSPQQKLMRYRLEVHLEIKMKREKQNLHVWPCKNFNTTKQINDQAFIHM